MDTGTNFKLKMDEVKLEIMSEISLPAVVTSTSDVPCLSVNIIKKEFSPEPHSCGGLVEHTIGGSMYTGTNLKLKIEEEIKPEITSETSIPTIVDFTSDVPYVTTVKTEFSPSKPHLFSGFVEDTVVKHEDTNTSIQLLNMKLKVPDLKCDMKSGDHDIHIKFEPLMSEELHIKDEDEESLNDYPKSRRYHCNICDYSCKWKSILQQHLHVHTGKKPFQCHVCDFKCSRKSNLQQHISRHTGEKVFECSICDYTSSQKSYLQRHINTHAGKLPLKCSLCEYKCIQKRMLQVHMKTHTGEKLFQCDVCDFKCIQKSQLPRHKQTHTGEKPFQCNSCNYRCIQRSHLQRHLKIHTGEKPFKCNICDYRCIQNSDLQQHNINTHIRKKPTQCNICDYRCMRNGYLQRHMSKHTGKKP